MDETHWPLIAAMRVKKYYPLDTPVPPQAPQHLLSRIKSYASLLFRTEANQYEQFRSDARFPVWLSRLSDRVLARTLTALDRIEDGDPDALLVGYHGLSRPEVEKTLRQILREIAQQYEQGKVPLPIAGESTKTEPQLDQDERGTISKESLAAQIKRLQNECEITAEAMAVAIEVEPRSIYRHLAGTAVPRPKHIAAYENLFSERLGKSVTLKRPVKRHQNVS
ncbi:MAG: hypothetical protein ABSC48_07725 [Terracidiphilus sp.]|jgi:hypothetical protein